jgi:two-component system, chemotaxis family, chemotaxis protein CheY
MNTTSSHIIIVDDQSGVRGVLARVVARTYPAVTITALGNGLEALQVFEKHGCDLLITNYQMPGLTGLELISEIRARSSSLPIIMVSADRGIEPLARAAGVSRFVEKPFTIPELAQVLRELLAS